MSDIRTNIPLPVAPLSGADGRVNEIWWRFFLDIFNRTGGGSGNDGTIDAVYPDIFASPSLSDASSGIQEVFGNLSAASTDLSPLPDVAAPLVQDQFAQEIVLAPVIGGEAGALPVSNITVGASPFTFTAKDRCGVHIINGTISALNFIRGSSTLGMFILSAGQIIELNIGDSVQVTYSVAPTMKLVPR